MFVTFFDIPVLELEDFLEDFGCANDLIADEYVASPFELDGVVASGHEVPSFEDPLDLGVPSCGGPLDLGVPSYGDPLVPLASWIHLAFDVPSFLVPSCGDPSDLEDPSYENPLVPSCGDPLDPEDPSYGDPLDLVDPSYGNQLVPFVVSWNHPAFEPFLVLLDYHLVQHFQVEALVL